MNRHEHEFLFAAGEISEAAAREADYHESRVGFWQDEYEAAVERVEATISAKVVRQPMSGGFSVDVVVDYGDRAAYSRMQQAFRKIEEHREKLESFRSDERLYATQNADRTYELSVDDVNHYRINAPDRQFDGLAQDAA